MPTTLVPEPRIPPIRKSLHVSVGVERAFEAFTAELGRWWPLATHSIGERNAIACAIEPHAGGRVFETLANGDELTWGRVLVWEPSQRLVYSWHLTGPVTDASAIEIAFVDDGDGHTRVELEHREWERYGGDRAAQRRDDYDSGWDHVLGDCYGGYVGRAVAGVPDDSK